MLFDTLISFQNSVTLGTLNGMTKVATFGAGCFWKPQHFFDDIPGVVKTTVGFMGGLVERPTYQQVCTNETGHAEVVQVEFDPAQVSYEKLVRMFWSIHDPTQLNRQGPDVGTQYRSVVFYHSPAQRESAERSRAELEKSNAQSGPIMTDIIPATIFYPAEDYHQKYIAKQRGEEL